MCLSQPGVTVRGAKFRLLKSRSSQQGSWSTQSIAVAAGAPEGGKETLGSWDLGGLGQTAGATPQALDLAVGKAQRAAAVLSDPSTLGLWVPCVPPYGLCYGLYGNA